MNKADIISKVHEVLDTTKADAERAVDAVFDSITAAMKDGSQTRRTARSLSASLANEADKKWRSI